METYRTKHVNGKMAQLGPLKISVLIIRFGVALEDASILLKTKIVLIIQQSFVTKLLVLKGVADHLKSMTVQLIKETFIAANQIIAYLDVCNSSTFLMDCQVLEIVISFRGRMSRVTREWMIQCEAR